MVSENLRKKATRDLWPAAEYESHPWQRADDEVASRRQRRAARGPYRAAVPPKIATRRVDLPSEVLALAEDASHELGRFDAELGNITAPFAAILLRTESASSSEVENLTSSAKQVALAELGDSSSANARLVVANVRAMNAAIELSDRLDTRAVIAMHRALLEEQQPHTTGAFRQEQVWIGGGSLSPHQAQFVPPHHEHVPTLMEDVMRFARRTDLPVLVHCAIAHAQFETIHPFTDGNGRTGRALLQGMLRAGRVTRNVSVPVSAGLLHDLEGYFAALTAYRSGELEPMIRALSEASFAAIVNGRRLVADLQGTRARWDEAATARVDSSMHRLKDALLRQPVVSTRSVAEALAISAVAAQTSIDRLVIAGVLTQAGGGRRNRRWQASEVLTALDAFGARAKRKRRVG